MGESRSEQYVRTCISEVESEMLNYIGHLINAKWDSPTLMKNIEELRNYRRELYDELERAETQV